MKKSSIKLYSLAAPLFALPMLGFSFNQIIPYLHGVEFRTFLAELLSQVASGVLDAVITAGVNSFVS
jgi:hypothetical protein